MKVAARDRERITEITSVAAKFGLQMLLAQFGLAKAKDVGLDIPPNLPQRTREAIEALGPTYVKLGQILATRQDILPEPWITELQKLHSEAPTLDFDVLRANVTEALGEEPEHAFAYFSTTPLAAASMAQVHRARLHDGQEVVVKIRRPDIRPRMQADLRLLTHLAEVAEENSAEIRKFRPRALVQQLLDTVLEELDFTNEGRNADRLREDFKGDPAIIIPVIHWSYSSETILVMDYVEGIAPRNRNRLIASNIDPKSIAEIGANLVLEMVLINGRFHGDPHPGNLLCLPGNRLALLDLGLVGNVSERRKREFLAFILSLRSGDAQTLCDTLMTWTEGDYPNRHAILSASEQLIHRHSQGPLILSKLVGDFFPLLRRENLLLPPDLILIFKALITMDGVLTAIQPDFDISTALQQSRGRLILHQLTGNRSPDKMLSLMMELSQISDKAPHLIRALITRLESDQAQVNTTTHLAEIISRSAKWVSFSLIGSGAIIAVALILAK